MSKFSAEIDLESNYARFREGIAKALPAFDVHKEKLQWGDSVVNFASGPLSANWSTGVNDYNAWALGSKNFTGVGPFFNPTDDLFAAYKEYVLSIDDLTEGDETLREYRTQFTRYEREHITSYSSYSEAFTSWSRTNHDHALAKDLNGWGDSIYGKKHLETVYSARRAYHGAFDNVLKRLRELESPLAGVWERLRKHEIAYTLPDGHISWRPIVNFDLNLREAIRAWDDKPEEEYDLPGIDVTQGRVHQGWHTITDNPIRNTGCFNVEVNGHNLTKHWYRDSSVKAVIKAKGLALVNIDRPWLDWSLLEKPAHFTKGCRRNHEHYFGHQGRLAQIPVAYLVAYKPGLSVSCNTALYESTTEALSHTATRFDKFSFLGTKFTLHPHGDHRLGHIVSQTKNTTVFNLDGPSNGEVSIVAVICRSFYQGLASVPKPIHIRTITTTTTTVTKTTEIVREEYKVPISRQAFATLQNIAPEIRGNKVWTISLHLPNVGLERGLDVLLNEWQDVERYLAEVFNYIVVKGVKPPDPSAAAELLVSHPYAATALLESYSFAIKDLDGTSFAAPPVVAANIKHCLLRGIPYWSEKDVNVSARHSPMLSALLYETHLKSIETIERKFVALYDDAYSRHSAYSSSRPVSRAASRSASRSAHYDEITTTETRDIIDKTVLSLDERAIERGDGVHIDRGTSGAVVTTTNGSYGAKTRSPFYRTDSDRARFEEDEVRTVTEIRKERAGEVEDDYRAAGRAGESVVLKGKRGNGRIEIDEVEERIDIVEDARIGDVEVDERVVVDRKTVQGGKVTGVARGIRTRDGVIGVEEDVDGRFAVEVDRNDRRRSYQDEDIYRSNSRDNYYNGVRTPTPTRRTGSSANVTTKTTTDTRDEVIVTDGVVREGVVVRDGVVRDGGVRVREGVVREGVIRDGVIRGGTVDVVQDRVVRDSDVVRDSVVVRDDVVVREGVITTNGRSTPTLRGYGGKHHGSLSCTRILSNGRVCGCVDFDLGEYPGRGTKFCLNCTHDLHGSNDSFCKVVNGRRVCRCQSFHATEGGSCTHCGHETHDSS